MLIVDTDVGGDPDDAIALVVAAGLPDLGLVITGDELGGERARLVRLLLDLLGRSDVPVVAGRDLGNRTLNCFGGLVPDDVPAQPTELIELVAAVCEGAEGPVRWVGLAPLSNLADVLTARPHLADRLVVTQMGGALNYRDPERAEHNFRMDPAAVSVVLATARRLSLVISDTTFSPHMEITRGSELHRRLADPVGPAWARVVSAHLDQWFARFYPGTRQHDSLALAAALSVPVLTMYDATVALDPIARMSLDPAGVEVRLSGNADYPAFMTWLSQRLNEALTRSSALGTNRDTPSADQLEADWQLVGGQACGDGVR